MTDERLPLSKREKQGALWAGVWGFPLLTFGFTLVMLPIIAALFSALFNFVINMIARSSNDRGAGFSTAQDFLGSIDYTLVAVLGGVVAVVGLAIMTGALFLSKGILRSHGVDRAWAVTWSGAGVAIAASWFLGWIPTIIVRIVGGLLDAMRWNEFSAAIFTGVLGLVLGIAVYAVIGWLSWWWMAHAFRRAPNVDLATTSNIQE